MYRYIYYPCDDGWRWKFVSPDGSKVMAYSGRAYDTETGVVTACRNMVKRHNGHNPVLKEV